MSDHSRERTEQDCLDALKRAADELGESPSKAQYEALGLTPAASTIIRVCGGWNAAKEQAELATETTTGSRVDEQPADVTLPEGVTWDELSANQRWHYRHAEQNSQQSLDRRQRLRAWLHIHKASLGCRRCDEADPACLDFHHVRGEKERSITKMVSYGYSAADIHAEIQKCEVLCANCHRKEHYSLPDPLAGSSKP